MNQRSIAAGQNTTVFLAKSSDKMSDLPRHPEDVEPPALCVMCETEKGDDDSPLECDKVNFFFVLLLVHLSASPNVTVRFAVPPGMPQPPSRRRT